MAYIKKGGNGGVRPNSGRPKTKKPEKEARQRFNFFVDENFEVLFIKLKEKALAGDVKALVFLFEQRIGKAPATLKVAGTLNISQILDDIEKTK